MSPSEGTFENRRTEAGGVGIHAKVSRGDGPPIVLVHGLGLSHRYVMPVAEELARHYRVFVPDMPGFGYSGHPDRVLDMPGLADRLAAWIRGEGLGPVPLLGNSQGCQVIGNLAVRHPDLVAQAILQGPTSPPEEHEFLQVAGAGEPTVGKPDQVVAALQNSGGARHRGRSRRPDVHGSRSSARSRNRRGAAAIVVRRNPAQPGHELTQSRCSP